MGSSRPSSTASVYAAFQGPALWATVIGTYGALNYDVDRAVPLGIASFAHHAETDGENWSVGGRAGYDFLWNGFTTGPLAGLLWQRARIDGFTETEADFTSLGFSDQARDSLVSTLGWRAKMRVGAWEPFAEVAWNHELASTDRNVTAYPTSSSYAPGYYMPAVEVGEDWGTATLGTAVVLGAGVVALGSVRTDFGDDGVQSFGAQFGINLNF